MIGIGIPISQSNIPRMDGGPSRPQTGEKRPRRAARFRHSVTLAASTLAASSGACGAEALRGCLPFAAEAADPADIVQAPANEIERCGVILPVVTQPEQQRGGVDSSEDSTFRIPTEVGAAVAGFVPDGVDRARGAACGGGGGGRRGRPGRGGSPACAGAAARNGRASTARTRSGRRPSLAGPAMRRSARSI